MWRGSSNERTAPTRSQTQQIADHSCSLKFRSSPTNKHYIAHIYMYSTCSLRMVKEFATNEAISHDTYRTCSLKMMSEFTTKEAIKTHTYVRIAPAHKGWVNEGAHTPQKKQYRTSHLLPGSSGVRKNTTKHCRIHEHIRIAPVP